VELVHSPTGQSRQAAYGREAEEMPAGNRGLARGFTLVELLVVMAIISLLVSVLIPSLANAKRQGQRVACASNLHQVYLGMEYYLEDNQRVYPCAPDPVSTSPFCWLWMGRGWRGILGPYIEDGISRKNPSVLWCPGDPAPENQYEATSYAYSLAFYHSDEQIDLASSPADCYTYPLPPVARRPRDVVDPHGKCLIGEWTSNHKPVDDDNGWWCWAGYRNFVSAAGNVACLDATDIRPANDALPDPNLTVGGLSGTDWPR
jgi:prepilin-type N-terminal cleavage/methylation domain-containing protein